MEEITAATENLVITDAVETTNPSGQNTPIAATTSGDEHPDNDDNPECEAHVYYIQIRDAADYRVVDLFCGDHDDPTIYCAWDNRVWAAVTYCDHHAEDHLAPLRNYGFVIHSDDYFREKGIVEIDTDEDFRLIGEVEQCVNCAKTGTYAPVHDHSAATKSD